MYFSKIKIFAIFFIVVPLRLEAMHPEIPTLTSQLSSLDNLLDIIVATKIFPLVLDYTSTKDEKEFTENLIRSIRYWSLLGITKRTNLADAIRCYLGNKSKKLSELKDTNNRAFLHRVALDDDESSIFIILRAAGLIDGWELISSKINGSSSVVHEAAFDNRKKSINAFLDWAKSNYMIEFLLSIQDRSGWTAFHVAAKCGHVEIINSFARAAGPEKSWGLINRQDRGSLTPLQIVALGCQEEIINAFINAIHSDKKYILISMLRELGYTADVAETFISNFRKIDTNQILEQ